MTISVINFEGRESMALFSKTEINTYLHSNFLCYIPRCSEKTKKKTRSIIPFNAECEFLQNLLKLFNIFDDIDIRGRVLSFNKNG